MNAGELRAAFGVEEQVETGASMSQADSTNLDLKVKTVNCKEPHSQRDAERAERELRRTHKERQHEAAKERRASLIDVRGWACAHCGHTYTSAESHHAKRHKCPPRPAPKPKPKPAGCVLGCAVTAAAREQGDNGGTVTVKLRAPAGVTVAATVRQGELTVAVTAVEKGGAARRSMQVKAGMVVVSVKFGGVEHRASGCLDGDSADDVAYITSGVEGDVAAALAAASLDNEVELVLRRRNLSPRRGWGRYKRVLPWSRRSAAQTAFLWRMFRSRPLKSHFVAAHEMRTAQQHGFKWEPDQWLAASQIKSWFSKKWAEQKAAAKKGAEAVAAFDLAYEAAMQAALVTPTAPGAPSAVDEGAARKMTVAELKGALRQRGLLLSGLKAGLLARLLSTLGAPAPVAARDAAGSGASSSDTSGSSSSEDQQEDSSDAESGYGSSS